MANPVVLRNPVQFMPLVVGQQAVNDGAAEGGLAQELGVDALAEYFRTDGRLPVAVASQLFSAAPRAVGAQAALLKVLESLCRHLRAFNMPQVTGRARCVHRAHEIPKRRDLRGRFRRRRR